MSFKALYIEWVKRKERYLAMFKDLGPAIRSDDKRIRIEETIAWSMRYLRKDDRIVWYLSILQRYALLKLRDKPISKTRRLKKKIQRRTAGFKDRRIIEDFDLFFAKPMGTLCQYAVRFHELQNAGFFFL